MKNIACLLALLGLSLAAWGQEPAANVAQRARIKAEREAADSAFHAEEKACYQKFAVNDCLKEAKSKRRQVMADLRRQEISLNDAERRRKAAERLQAVERRTSTEQHRPQAPNPDAAAAGVRAGVRPAKAPPQVPAEPRKAKTVDAEAREADAAKSRTQHEQRLIEAEERKAKLEKRLKERTKPAAKPLAGQP